MGKGIGFGKKLVACTMMATSLYLFTGCSDFIDGFYQYRLERKSEEIVEQINEDFFTFAGENSIEDIEEIELLAEQEEIFDYSLKKLEFEYVSVTVDEGHKSATMTFNAEYYDAASIFADTICGSVEDYEGLLDGAKVTKEKLKMKMTYKDGEWLFDDFNEFITTIKQPYSELVILDEEGVAINPNAKYMSLFIEDMVWYNPLDANPLGSAASTTVSCSYREAVQNYLYFNQPMSGDITVELYCNDSLVYTGVYTLENDITYRIDVPASDIGGSSLTAGTYVLKIVYDGEAAFESDSLVIN